MDNYCILGEYKAHQYDNQPVGQLYKALGASSGGGSGGSAPQADSGAPASSGNSGAGSSGGQWSFVNAWNQQQGGGR